METIRKIEQFLKSEGNYSFNPDRHRKDVDAVEDICRRFNISVEYYLMGVFQKRLSEQLTHMRVEPYHLHGEWAMNKFTDWLKLGASVSPSTMEIEFIKRTRVRINQQGMTEEDYLSGGLLIPPVLSDIKKHRVSMVYCANKPSFVSMFKRLPRDLNEEFFEGIDVLYIQKHTRLNKSVLKAIND